MTYTNKNYSVVIMGDLVRSESTLPQNLLYKYFNDAINQQNIDYKRKLISPLTITLGDEFQGIVCSLSLAAEIAQKIRYQLLENAVECRFVIGQVEIKTPINTEKAWNMMGPGLARAREKLNRKNADMLYRFSLKSAPVTELLLDALGAGLSTIERSWTNHQRKDIISLIRGLTPSELAERRQVTVHSIYKVRSSGDYDTYRIEWDAIKMALEALDNQKRLS